MLPLQAMSSATGTQGRLAWRLLPSATLSSVPGGSSAPLVGGLSDFQRLCKHLDVISHKELSEGFQAL